MSFYFWPHTSDGEGTEMRVKGRTDRMGGVADTAEPQWPETRRGYPHTKGKIEIR
jgi:hypothetical protein